MSESDDRTPNGDQPRKIRDIPGWSNYLVSDDGRVWSKKFGIFLKPRYRKDGYVSYRLYRKGLPNGRLLLAHRLVLEAWVCLCPAGWEADHMNRNRSDNRRANLRWVTKSMNCTERRTFRFGPNNHPMRKLTDNERRIVARSSMRNVDLARQYGISKTHVGRLKCDQRYAA